MNLEVGMYVRINEDMRIICLGIGKVLDIIQDNIYVDMRNKLPISFDIKKITKASHNIIDLIEEGDYVNGYLVTGFDETYFNGNDRLKEAKRIAVEVDRDSNMGFRPIRFKNDDIKLIATKEQMVQISYKIGEER